MFLPTPSGELRQGDLCEGVPFPAWNLNDYLVARPHQDGAAKAVVSLLKKGETVPVVICSHDCTLDNVKAGTLGGISVAPVLPWPFPNNEEESLRLQRSGSPDDESKACSFPSVAQNARRMTERIRSFISSADIGPSFGPRSAGAEALLPAASALSRTNARRRRLAHSRRRTWLVIRINYRCPCCSTLAFPQPRSSHP